MQQQHTHIPRIDPATQVGLVSLTVADLDRSVAFYSDALGFAVVQQTGPAAILGVAGTPLLLLTEHTGARPWPVYATGLYHFAILVPSRVDLGRSETLGRIRSCCRSDRHPTHGQRWRSWPRSRWTRRGMTDTCPGVDTWHSVLDPNLVHGPLAVLRRGQAVAAGRLQATVAGDLSDEH
jgi:catechol 2,3-dioxygenase-like lactoylglutathione lyase family enzyme